MKNKWVIMSSILASALVHGSSQTSGGGGGGASGGASGSGGGATANGSVSTGNGAQNNTTVNPNLAPGLQNRQQLPPGLQNRQQLPPGLAMRTNNVGVFSNQMAFTNQAAFTNQFASRTNRFGSDTNLSPTGRFGTNRFSGTNHFRPRDFDRDRFRDEASTPSDRTLLIQIKQTIITQISVSGVAGAGTWVPIHFRIHSGRVSLMGLVANAQQAQQIQSMVSQMPGVVGVENGLSTLPQDQALNENDRVILTQIRQVVPPTQPAGPWTPVSFDVRQGAVAIAGIVPSVQESQRIETTVRQVPGVVQTSNMIVVDQSSSAGVSGSPASTVPQQ
jgi:osmotically-inducible protein OsmY